MKRQPVNWEKIFSNDATYKGLIFKMCKQLIQLNNKKRKKKQQPNQRMGRRPKQTDGQQAHEKMLNITNY